MKSWELDEIFLLVSSVFKENDLCNFWEAEKDLLLDQLIVRRVTSLHFQEEVIKEEREDFDLKCYQENEQEKHTREHNVRDFDSNGNVETEKKLMRDRMSNDHFHFNSLDNACLNFSEENDSNEVPTIKSTANHAKDLGKEQRILCVNKWEKVEVELNEHLPEKLGNDFGNDEGIILREQILSLQQDAESMAGDLPQEDERTADDLQKDGKMTADDLHQNAKMTANNLQQNREKSFDGKNLDGPFVKEKRGRKPKDQAVTNSCKLKDKNKLLKCKYCGKGFTSEKRLRAHETKVHIEGSIPTCKICYRRFKTVKNAIKHCEDYHGQIAISSNCDEISEEVKNGHLHGDSDLKFGGKDEILKGIKQRKERAEKKERQCPICQVAIVTGFGAMGEFRKHILNHFQKKIVCPICNVQYFSDKAMYNHIKKHVDRDPDCVNQLYKCSFCTALEFSADKIAYHEEMKHGHEVPLSRNFVCHCSKAFTTQSTLDWHVLIAHIKYNRNPETIQKPKKKVSCEICGKVLTQSALKPHIEKHNGVERENDRHGCTDCEKTFHSAYALKNHRMATHLKIERKCPICGKVFLNRIGFQHHVTKTHSDSRHSCLVCGKSYSLKDNLRVHIRRVHKGKPARTYKCSSCPQEFNRPSLKAKHELKHRFI